MGNSIKLPEHLHLVLVDPKDLPDGDRLDDETIIVGACYRPGKHERNLSYDQREFENTVNKQASEERKWLQPVPVGELLWACGYWAKN